MMTIIIARERSPEGISHDLNLLIFMLVKYVKGECDWQDKELLLSCVGSSHSFISTDIDKAL